MTVTDFYDDGTNLFAGTESKGIYRSPDHGSTWFASNTGIETKSVFSITEDDTYLYAGTDSGVYRSPDFGVSWEPANTGIETAFANCLLSANGYLFMGSIGTGVYRSGDHGTTWTDVNDNTLTFSFIKAMCYSGGRLIVEADNYIWYSLTDGNNWNLDTGPTQFYFINRLYAKGDSVIAATGGGFFPDATVFVSFDAINSWSGPFSVSNEVSLSGIALRNDTIFVGSKEGIFSSADWGNSWDHPVQTGLRFGNRLQNDFILTGGSFLLSYDEIGVYSTQNGINWIESKNGFPPSSTIDNCMITSGTDIWTGTHSDGVYMTTDGGANWTHSGAMNITVDTLPNAIVFSMLDAGDNLLLAGTCGDGLYRSDNYGSTWTHITNGFTPGFDNFLCIFSLAKSGDNLLAGTTTGMYHSDDNGLTWQQSTLSTGDYQVQGIAVHGNVVCAGVIPLGTTTDGGIYRSTDNGISFSFASAAVVDPVTLESDGFGNFYAGTLFDFSRSTDDGINWSGAGAGIPFNSGAFAIKAIDENVFVGNSAGVFYSNDAGLTFTAASEGLDDYPNNAVQGFTVEGGYLYAGLFRNAVWKRNLADFGLPTATIPEPHSITSNHFAIVSISANDISFEADLDESVNSSTIELLDVSGRVLKTLAGGTLAKGVHRGTMDISGLPAGIYFLEFKSKEFIKVVKWSCVR